MQVPQTSYILAFLGIGFLVFITLRGELTLYKQAIFGATLQPAKQGTTGQ